MLARLYHNISQPAFECNRFLFGTLLAVLPVFLSFLHPQLFLTNQVYGNIMQAIPSFIRGVFCNILTIVPFEYLFCRGDSRIARYNLRLSKTTTSNSSESEHNKDIKKASHKGRQLFWAISYQVFNCILVFSGGHRDPPLQSSLRFGAEDVNRTRDLQITKLLLYLLSYSSVNYYQIIYLLR